MGDNDSQYKSMRGISNDDDTDHENIQDVKMEKVRN